MKLNKIKKYIEKAIIMLKYVYIIIIISIPIILVCFINNYNKEKLYVENITKIHFSIDDTIDVFYNLKNNEDIYTSIFDEPTLKYLYYLHNKYDAKFTLYVFYEKNDFNLNNCSEKFKDEFRNNSSWLKFGFYGKNNYSDYSKDYVLNDYEETIESLVKIVGEESISNVIRMPFFKSTNENVRLLVNSKYPISGLLGADTQNRDNYYLTNSQNEELFKNDIYFDNNNNIYFYNTDSRIENMGYSWKNQDIKQDDTLYIFTHESLITEKYMIKIDYLLSVFDNVEYVIY